MKKDNENNTNKSPRLQIDTHFEQGCKPCSALENAKDVNRDPNNPQPMTTTRQEYTFKLVLQPERLELNLYERAKEYINNLIDW